MCRKVIRSICTNHRRVYHETQTLYTLEDFAVLDTLYLAFHAIYRVAAVQLVRNYGILQQNMIITPRNFAFLPASRLREMEKKANVAVSRDASRSIVRSDTSEMQERGFILDCCLRPIVTSKSRVGGILINRKLIVCECSSVVHEWRLSGKRGCYNEEAGWSEHGEAQPWRLYCCRAMLIMSSMYIPSFIYEFVTRVVRILWKSFVFFLN